MDIWEPKSSLEKLICLCQNIDEAFYVLMAGVLAISFPSAISLTFLILSSTLYMGMTSHQNSRYKINKMIMVFIIFCLVVTVSTKYYKINGLLTDEEKEVE